MDRKPLSASEVDEIAELAVSGLGRSFRVVESDIVEDGLWAGVYDAGQKIQDQYQVTNNIRSQILEIQAKAPKVDTKFSSMDIAGVVPSAEPLPIIRSSAESSKPIWKS